MSLVSTLNTLLTALCVPLTLQSPTDLTPSLLLGIIESILQSSLPISPSLRTSTSPAAKIQAMKIFLGVLGNDILKTDVGLSMVDPRRLARGEWDEVVFIGELLCWLGHNMGFLVQPRDLPVYLRAASPSTQSRYTDLSIHSVNRSSDTSFLSQQSNTPPALPQPRPVPRCIHEVGEPSLVLPVQYHDSSAELRTPDTSIPSVEESYCDCRHAVPVRHTGWINEVDVDLEVQSFESSRRSSSDLYSGHPSIHHRSPPTGPRIITKHTSPSQHTLALLNERAKLLAELARLAAPRESG